MLEGAPPVAATALWTAACRAEETTRPRPLVIDPWASRLLGDEGLEKGRALERRGRAHDAIVVRTRVIDERLASAILLGGARSIVLLGAGLDARPLRFAADVEWIEVDFEATIAWKRARLASLDLPKVHRLVAIDLGRSDQVASLLDELVGPAVVVLEGVLPYLDPDDARRLLSTIAARPSTTVLCDLGGGAWSAALGRRTARVVSACGAPFRTRVRDPRRYLEELGFVVTANVSLVEWDELRTERRFRAPWTARVLPGYRDAARVLEAISARTS